jgi:hypothetical protein
MPPPDWVEEGPIPHPSAQGVTIYTVTFTHENSGIWIQGEGTAADDAYRQAVAKAENEPRLNP